VRRIAIATMVLLCACKRDAPAPTPAPTPSLASATASASSSASAFASAQPPHAVTVDGHADTPTEWLEHAFDVCASSTHQVDFPKMRVGGLDVELFAAYVPAKHADVDAYAFTAKLVDDIHTMVGACPSDAAIALGTDEIRAVVASGRRAIVISIEGGHAIEDSLEKLGYFYTHGVRLMTLTHFNTNHWADASTDAPKHHGLSKLGEDVVHEMNRLGMMVDVSHTSDETFWDVMATSTAPVVASHSCARALCDKKRNMDDDMLRALGKHHGVVMINFLSMYLDCTTVDAGDKSVKPSRIVDHIEHAIDIAGIDAVGLGSDFGNPEVAFPEGMEDVSKLGFIADELHRRGHSDDDVRKVMGENFMRVFAEVERVAREKK
jgi:membrane dipeptidase